MINFLTKFSIRYTIPALIGIMALFSISIGYLASRNQMRLLEESEIRSFFKERLARSQENLELLLREEHFASIKHYMASFSINKHNLLTILVDEDGIVLGSTDSKYLNEKAMPLLKNLKTPFENFEFKTPGIKIQTIAHDNKREFLHGLVDLCGNEISLRPIHQQKCGYLYSIIEITSKIQEMEKATLRVLLFSGIFTFMGSNFFIFIIYRLLTVRTHKILNTIEKFQDGLLHSRVNINGNDEIYMIAEAVNQTFDKIERHETALRETALSLKKAQVISNMGNWIWDMRTNELIWSDQIYRIFGLEPGEIKPDYTAFLNFIHPDDVQKVSNAIQNSIDQKITYKVEHRIIRKDGEVRNVEEIGEIETDSAGNKLKMNGVVIDITQKVKTREDLELYRQMIERTADPVFMIDDDDNCRMVFVNEAAVSHFGAPVDEILTWHIPDWDPNFSYERLPQHIQEVKSIKNMFIETNHRKKNGEIVPVEISINYILYNGRSCHFGYFRNISKRKESEQMLKESEEKYSSLVHGSHDAIVIIQDGVLKFVNTAATKMLGYSESELFDMRFLNFISPSFRKLVGQRYQERIDGKDVPNIYQIDLQNRNEEIIPVEINANVISYHGKPADMVAIRDLSERNKFQTEIIKAKEMAEQANKAKSEFLANMSHEIRTPMNAIMGFTEILEKKITGLQEKKYLNSIKTGSKTLLRLINDILDLSKVEAGKMALEYNYFNAKQVIYEIVNIFSSRAEEKELLLISSVAEDIPEGIYLDEIRVRQIIINIVSNAIKFTHTGKVTISCSVSYPDEDKESLQLMISVKDTGIGISEEDKNEIFEAFSQKAGHSNFGGTGLGLTISKRLANMMNGDIKVFSELNKGSEFQIIFQNVHFHDKLPEEIMRDNASENVIFSHASVLIVDDIASNRDLIRGFFDDSDLDFIEAVNGKMGVEYAREYKPDIIFMDLRMPVMDGYEATLALKEDPETKNIPLVVASASGMEKKVHEMEPIINGYLRKPFAKKDIVDILKKYLNYKTIEKEEIKPAVISITHEKTDNLEIPSNIEAILEILNQKELENCDSICQELDFSKIAEFSKDLRKKFNLLGYQPLIRWSDNLENAAEMVDIEEIRLLTRKLHEIEQYLKENNKN